MLAAPGSPLDPRARGCNDLIRQGAALCEGAEDVLRAIEAIGGFRAPPPPAYMLGDEESSPELLERGSTSRSRPRSMSTNWRVWSAPRRARCSRPWSSCRWQAGWS